jgi:hypothetical protein
MTIAPWRMNLQPATYNGALFFVDVDSRIGGRRKHLHEFPKKDIPYLEDLGKKALHFGVVGYVIGPNYEDMRDQLIAQLESSTDGRLVHPTYKTISKVGVDSYTVVERRERGGYAEFDMHFVELGQDVNTQNQPDTPGQVNSAADAGAGASAISQGSDPSLTDPGAVGKVDPTSYQAAVNGTPMAMGLLAATPGLFMLSQDIRSLNPAPPAWW